MTQVTTQEQQYETPTFSPRGAFATTLRSAELARTGRLVRQSPPPDAGRTARQISHPARRYETPTFSPRSAFATTLRSAEIARRERERRQIGTRQLEVLAYAA